MTKQLWQIVMIRITGRTAMNETKGIKMANFKVVKVNLSSKIALNL